MKNSCNLSSVKKSIWHVYYGTRGISGAYIDALQRASEKAGILSYAFVSRYYQFKTPRVLKLFFPITDKIEKRNFVIKIFRALELASGYALILIMALFTRPIINLHLIDDFCITYFFFQLCKLLKIEIFLTCHDIISHVGMANSRRLKMFHTADKLIIHNRYAKNSLLKIFNENGVERILQYPYPYSAYDSILSGVKIEKAENNLFPIIGGENSKYFLFIGVVRYSKGIETLLDAWNHSSVKHQNRLVIAGKWGNMSKSTRDIAINFRNCIVFERYLNDEEFVVLIKNARFVVLPYLETYTHSAVLMACARCGTAVIISDIGLFKELLPEYPLTFQRGDVHELSVLLERAGNMSDTEINFHRKLLQEAVERSDQKLIDEIRVAYQP